MKKINKPQPQEYDSFYAGYVHKIGEASIVPFLISQLDSLTEILEGLDDSRLLYAYEDNKWSIAELIGHIIDVERVMSYRVLRFSRKDQTVLPGFDQDLYVLHGNHNDVSKESLITEWRGLRKSNIEMINRLIEEQCIYTGTASGVIFSVRALIYILGGHAEHHLDILKQRYLPNH
ncbi:MAG: DinB family protein [Cyclobacteriaceae bacterium]